MEKGITDSVVDGVFGTTREKVVSINIDVMFAGMADGGSDDGVKGNT
jgi:hypothetical protein